MILAVMHQKGGTGKSTLSIALSLWLSRRGQEVILIDTDTQGTSTNWGRAFGREYGIEVHPSQVRILEKDIEEVKDGYDHIILDLPPSITAQTEKAVQLADAILIPSRPTLPDVWALDRLVALIWLSGRKPPPPCTVLFTQCEAAEAAPHIETLKKRRLHICEHTIPRSDDWSELFAGKPLTDAQDVLLAKILACCKIEFPGLNSN